MKLSEMLAKLKTFTQKKVVDVAKFDSRFTSKNVSSSDSKGTSSKTNTKTFFKGAGEQIIIKENKNNALIKCWKDGKESWVKKGSPCFNQGLCSKCI